MSFAQERQVMVTWDDLRQTMTDAHSAVGGFLADATASVDPQAAAQWTEAARNAACVMQSAAAVARELR